MAAILKNGCHFFPAEYPEGRPHRKCAEMSSEQAHTHEPFTTAHVSRTLFAPWVLGMELPLNNDVHFGVSWY